MNLGEEICGEWLRHVQGCEFVQYNVRTSKTQGEVDVIGIDLDLRVVHACEVAVHLVTGLQYVANGKVNNVSKLVDKFGRDIEYLRDKFPAYQHRFMLWSPVVKTGQLAHLEMVGEEVKATYGVEVEMVVNHRFDASLRDLRAIARNATKEQTSSVMRYLQIEEHLSKHLASTPVPSLKTAG